MIRDKDLLKRFEEMLEEEVDLGPRVDISDLLPPLDSILPFLYNGNERVQKVQERLSEERKLDLGELLESHNILNPIEEITLDLVEMNLSYPPYYHLAAKVVFVGDKLDEAVEGKLSETEIEFKEGYKIIRDKKSSLTQVEKAREQLDKYLVQFETLEKIFVQRDLDEKKSKSSRTTFEDYREKKKKIEKLDAEIEVLIGDYYTKNSREELAEFSNQVGKETRRGIFSGDTLGKKCKEADYVEGIVRLEEIKKDSESLVKNFKQFEATRNLTSRLRKETDKLRTEYASFGASLDRIDRLGGIYIELGEIPDEKISKLRGDIDKEGLREYVNLVRDEFLEQIDKVFAQVLEDDSKAEFAFKLYEQFSGIQDVGERLEKARSLFNVRTARVDYENNLSKAKQEASSLRRQLDEAKKYKQKTIEAQKEIERHSKKAGELEVELEGLKSSNSRDNLRLSKLSQELGGAQKELNRYLEVQTEEQKAESWNNKYSVNDKIVYEARDGRVWDVRDFIQSRNNILEAIVEENNLRGESHDDTVYRCEKYVKENVVYTSDIQLSDYPEEWLFPSETVQTKAGDCEDGTNLVVSLARVAGVPAYRIKNACGKAEGEGHSWGLYLREGDDNWIITDWCFKPTEKKIQEREPARTRRDYQEIWFSFNDEHSWSENELGISADYLRNRKRAEKPIKIIVDDSRFELSLGARVENLGIPSNTHYFGFSNILVGDFEADYFQRFKRFTRELSETRPSGKREDIEYMERLKMVLDDTRKQEHIARGIGGNNGCGKVVSDMMATLSDYITSCKEIAA
ncbi:MAG: transglutaminase domain-containing protein [archaeon]